MRIFHLFLLILITSFSAFPQDDELNRLTQVVNSLKSGGEKSYQKAVATLAADKLWTPMDELATDRSAECKASERTPGFRLNSVLTNAENAERYQTTTANHLNGADARYSYSLYEKTVKAGKSASYSLPGRSGEQTFIVIPYSGELTVSVSSGATQFDSSPLGKGAVRLSGRVANGEPVKIRVENRGSANVSYVIINHNSRK